MAEQKLKVQVEAETSQFKKGMTQAKNDLRDFEKVSKGSLDSLGRMFGVNVGKLRELSGAFRGLSGEMTAVGNVGSSALGSLASGVGALGAGLAGLGIAALVAEFKLLNAEAERFNRTVQGTKLMAQTTAYIDTFDQVLADMRGIGESVAKTQSSFEKFKKRLGGSIADMALTGAIYRGPEAMAASVTRVNVAVEKAEKAWELTGKLKDQQQQLNQATRDAAALDVQIAELRRDAYDHTKSRKEQEEAIAKAVELTNQKYNALSSVNTAIADTMDEINSLASSSEDALNKATQQRVIALNLDKARNEELKSLERREGSIVRGAAGASAQLSKARQREAELLREAKEEAMAYKRVLDSVANTVTKTSLDKGPAPTLAAGIPAYVKELKGVMQFDWKGLTVGIGFKIDKQKFFEITREIEAMVEDLASNVGESLGLLFSDLLTGNDAWKNFGNAALSAMGDLAVSVGKLAIATGVASLGIKAALESLNGWVAIAAGTALVALGTAVKGSLSNIASGSYSSAQGVASTSSASYAASSYNETREANVRVTGTLRASGSQLVAVINSENDRKKHTT